MSGNYNPSLDTFKEPNNTWTHNGSEAAGRHQAENNQPFSGQQPGESAASLYSRQAAYNHTNANKNSG